jgi:hypothetical protein
MISHYGLPNLERGLVVVVLGQLGLDGFSLTLSLHNTMLSVSL